MNEKTNTSDSADSVPAQSQKSAISERSVSVWSAGDSSVRPSDDQVTSETPVALVYNEVSHAVMMASPCDLEAFAIGFSLSEGIVDAPEDIFDIAVSDNCSGIEVAVTLSNRHFDRLKQRRRSLAGRTGCGLCGAESLQQVRLPTPSVESAIKVTHEAIAAAVGQLDEKQTLQAITGGFHSAAWCDEAGQIVSLCEDVGRHNALDKLIGTLAKSDRLRSDMAGFVLMSSRASYEIVQKAAMAKIAIVVAVSAPTSFAIDIAEEVGITLVGFARTQRHVCYTNSQRVYKA